MAALGVVLGIAGGLVFALTRTAPDSAPPPPGVEAPVTAVVEDVEVIEEPAEPKPLTAQDWEAELGGEPEFASEDVPELPTRGAIVMPIARKLAPEPLSAVNHELVGAWDEAPDSEEPGRHRTIVAVVDPSMSSKDLEQLLWDIRRQHEAADVLDVRVYDSAEASTRASTFDGGAERASHLVADVKRNDRLGFDRITVRGEVVGP
jgi:hypothetical protein